MQHFALVFCFIVFATLIAGCGISGPPVQFIDGTVSIDGVLVEAATVTLVPKNTPDSVVDNTRPLSASGNTDSNGYFRLSAMQGGAIDRGTTVGEYTIVISKRIDTQVRTEAAHAKLPPIWRYDVPRLFESESTSPISIIVVKGKNRFDFDLKSDGTFKVNGQ